VWLALSVAGQDRQRAEDRNSEVGIYADWQLMFFPLLQHSVRRSYRQGTQPHIIRGDKFSRVKRDDSQLTVYILTLTKQRTLLPWNDDPWFDN
jgi:hypothetical protein